jgi:hypothetical protein
MSNNFLDLNPKPSPFELASPSEVQDDRLKKPVITKVAPSKVLDRAKMFLAMAETAPPVNLENESADEEDGQVITLNLGLAPQEALPAELFRKE